MIHLTSRRISKIWFANLFLFLAVFGMFLSTPRSAGPDEPKHQATAWFVIHHGFITKNTHQPVFDIPQSLTVFPGCYAFKSNIGAGCMPPRSVDSTQSSVSDVFNYPPLYYYVVGLGQALVADTLGQTYADLGGRIASILLNLCVLFFAYRKLRHIYADPGGLLMMISTPMMMFLWAVVNPSGFEIATAILCAVYVYGFLKEDIKNQQEMLLSRNFTKIGLALTIFLFVNSRPIAFLWFGLLTLFIYLNLRSERIWKSIGSLIVSAVPGFIFLITTTLFLGTASPGRLPGYTPNPDPNVIYYVRTFATTVFIFPDRLGQMVGNLGWLDTPTPNILVISYIIFWVIFFSRQTHSLKKRTFLLLISTILIIPCAIETVYWNSWPGWWQGRYTLPLLIGILVIYFLKQSNISKINLKILILGSGVINITMLLENLLRYSFGVSEYLPAQISRPQIGFLRFDLVMCTLAVMIILLGKIYVLYNLDEKN